MAQGNPASRGRWQRSRRWLRQFLQIRIVLPSIVGVGLAAYVISIAIAPKSGGQFWAIVHSTWWIVLLMTVPYLAVRAYVWRRLLLQLDVEVPLRPFVAAFAAGEITKTLPAGVYVENFLLRRLAHISLHATLRSTMATTATLALESLVAVPVVLIIGIPGLPWLFWAVLGCIVAWLLLLGIAWLLIVQFGAHRLSSSTTRWLRGAIESAESFLKAGGDLITWRTLVNLVPTAFSMLVYVVDLYVIVRAVGVRNVSFAETMAIYGFMVLTVILIPIPTELGLTEFTGLTGLLAFGIPHSTAAIIVLALRALATGMTILIAGALYVLARGAIWPFQRDSDAERAAARTHRLL